MRPASARKFSLFVNIVLWVALFAGTHFLVFQPLFIELDKAAKKTTEVGQLFTPARDGDPVAMARLEQMTHENSGLAYLVLMAIERKHAIKASGVDLNDPHANIGSIDVTKTDALLMQAMRELSDLELVYVLRSQSSAFDSTEQAKERELTKDESVLIRNHTELDTRSTLDQATKDGLLSCRDKLAKKYDSVAISLLNLHTSGTCSMGEPKTTYASFKSNMASFGVESNAIEGLISNGKGEPSAN
jgi:hypothetical protein